MQNRRRMRAGLSTVAIIMMGASPLVGASNSLDEPAQHSPLKQAVRQALTSVPNTTPTTTTIPDPEATLIDEMFAPTCATSIEITADQTSLDALLLDPKGAYQPATMLIDVCSDGGDESTVERKIEFRLKGSSSFRSLNGKAAFRIRIDKTSRFGGYKSMTLNNMVQDDSKINEVVGAQAYAAVGVVASRAAYATVKINGVDYGLYANIETLDDVMLDATFGAGDTVHLYEGPDFLDGNPTFEDRDVVPGAVAAFQVDEGDEADITDLTALAATSVTASDEEWWVAFQTLAAEREFLRQWAVDRYIANWDSYATVTNYSLYNGVAGGFRMVPSGLDRTFGVEQPFVPQYPWFGTSSGILERRCNSYAPCRAMYLTELIDVGRTLNELDLGSLALAARDAVADLIAADTRDDIDETASCVAANQGIDFMDVRPAKWAEATGEPAPVDDGGPTPRLDCSP
jgi:CotH kinase protein